MNTTTFFSRKDVVAVDPHGGGYVGGLNRFEVPLDVSLFPGLEGSAFPPSFCPPRRHNR